MRPITEREAFHCFPFEAGLVLFVSTVALILLWTNTAQVNAQGGSWQEPINISNSVHDSQSPSIVADPSNMVHVVWCEAVESDQCDTIYYVSSDGVAWSTPLDIVFSAGGSAYSPVLVTDQSGMLHMAWVGGYTDRVLYSHAYAPIAGSAQRWQAPIAIGEPVPMTTFPDLALDATGNLHLVYTVRSGEQNGVYYSQSSDGGRTWRTPVPMFARTDKAVDQARLAVDEAGGIHVVWTEGGIRYSQSVDGGGTWSEQLLIDGPYGFGGIVTVGEEQVHLFWSGTAPDRKKFHRWSADGGETWSPVIITHEVGGYQGWPAVASDSANALHLLQVSDFDSAYRVGLYYQVWQNESWSPAVRLRDRVEGSPNHATNPDIAVGLGNELHVVVADMVQSPAGSGNWFYDIFYLHGLADAARLEPKALATPTLASAPTAASRPAATIAPVEAGPTAATGAGSLEAPIGHDRDPILTMLPGILSALVLLGGVIAVRLLYKSRP